ncbi:MAG: hypothetical protein LBU90_04990 [Bacteroidales bacterium]|jgi:hypothetical protein|nr:hypothetical protein [Bacteroidales bacterium]
MKSLKKLKLDSEKMKFEILNEGFMNRIRGGAGSGCCCPGLCDKLS